MANNNRLIVVSGPSGVGKTTLLKSLFEKFSDNLSFSVSYTTRAPRKNEQNGVDYFFVDQDEFKDMIEKEDFLEWAEVYGNFYGTSRDYIESIIKKGKHCILDIDVQGALTIMEKDIEASFIFIAPESIDILRERLLKRSTDSMEAIKKRINIAEKELTHKEKYDYIVVNKNLDEAIKELETIIFHTLEA